MRNSAQPPRMVKDLMTFDVQTLLPTDTVDDARDRMLVGAINAIPIVAEGGQTVGMVTSHDMVDEWEADTPLSACMSLSVVTIESTASVVEAAQLMRAELIHHLVVTDSGRAVGVLSTFDLLDALAD